MPRRVIAQPLPLDLRNWSFRGANCEGWDFSGRDIRGCDFRNAKLKGANFRGVIAGRSQRQILATVAGSIAGAGTGVITGLIVGAGAGASTGALVGVLVAGAVAGAVAVLIGAVAVLGTVLGASAGTVAIAVIGSVTVLVAGSVTVLGVVFGAVAVYVFESGNILGGIVGLILAIGCLLIAFYSAREAIREIKAATGTDFASADLQGVDFSHAKLNNCNFAGVNTQYVNWSHATGNHTSILKDTHIQLMTSRQGNSAMYSKMDLNHCHLAGVELIKANLSGSDLTRSNFQHADLSFANLTNIKAGGTDFRHATLTGSCIQNWTINSETQFDGLTCDFIYLTPDRDPQHRRPLSGSFESGDFEKLLDHFADTLDFMLRRGTDPIAFNQALNQFKQDNPEAQIKSINALDPDRVLVQATVPEGTDKVKAYEDFQDNQAKLQAANERIRYLEGRDEANQENRELISQLLLSSKPDIKLIQANHMTDKSTKNQAGGDVISVGDNTSGVIGKDLTGVAGRDISGTLNLNLAALRQTEDPQAKDLADLITYVRDAIEAPDCDLDDRHKQRALTYLDNLTQLAKDQPEDRLQQAKDNLDDLTDIAEKGSKLAGFAEKYFPTVMSAISAIGIWFGVSF
jgi:uncharacterized protein YjbI with pentapeptide repeats